MVTLSTSHTASAASHSLTVALPYAETHSHALGMCSSTDCSPSCHVAFENSLILMRGDNCIQRRGNKEKERENESFKSNILLTGLWRRLEMRFFCWGPEPGVECWGDWRPSGTPSLGLRCTGVPLGVGDLLIFYCFAVGVLQPGVGGENCKKKKINCQLNIITF